MTPETWVDTVNPVTGKVTGRYGAASVDDVNDAVVAARNALTGEWGKMSTQDRVDILYKIADGINARFDEFLEAECLDTGKPYSLASKIDIPRGAANFKIFADTVKNSADEAFHMPTPDGTGALNYTIRKTERRNCGHWSVEFTTIINDLESRASVSVWQHRHR